MGKRTLDLKSILNIPQFEVLQDALAKATGTAIVTVDFKGIPLTKHSFCTDFCRSIRDNPISRKRCYRCDALAGLEAVRLNRPFIYLCHCGIVDVAVPVMVGDKYLGAVMFGQVKIPNNDTDGKVEHLVSEISSFQAEEENTRRSLLEKYSRIPDMEYRRVVEIADMIDAIVQYIVDRAIDDRNRAATYEWMMHNIMPPTLDSQMSYLGSDIQDLRTIPAPIILEEDTLQAEISKSSPVYPAICYIEDHKHEMVKMRDMASLCHLSSSYFSKLFPKEVGETFTDYVNRRKVAWSKKLLRETNDSVSNIAIELGFVDVSYFIRIFKKFEGITPHVYRQHKYK